MDALISILIVLFILPIIIFSMFSETIFARSSKEKDDIYIIAGAYYGEKAVVSIINSDEMKKVNKVINLELDKRIKELSDDKKDKEN